MVAVGTPAAIDSTRPAWAAPAAAAAAGTSAASPPARRRRHRRPGRPTTVTPGSSVAQHVAPGLRRARPRPARPARRPARRQQAADQRRSHVAATEHRQPHRHGPCTVRRARPGLPRSGPDPERQGCVPAARPIAERPGRHPRPPDPTLSARRPMAAQPAARSRGAWRAIAHSLRVQIASGAHRVDRARPAAPRTGLTRSSTRAPRRPPTAAPATGPADQREAGGEADGEGGPEAVLDRGVQRAQDAIELGRVERRQGQLAPQEHRVLGPDREVGTDETVVAAQQVLVELGVVLLGRRHHVGLVAQRPLAEREPDGGDVLLLAPHPHVPAPRHLGVTVDRRDDLVAGPRRRPATSRWHARGRRASSSLCIVAQLQSTRAPTVRSA